MSLLNILTVTIAYPSIINEVNGIFVKETVKCIAKINNTVVLSCVIINNENKIKAGIYEKEEDSIKIIRVFVKKSFLPEMILTTLGILKGLRYIKKKQIKIDVIHAHFFASAITFLFFMRDIPVVITEHSSIFTFKQLSFLAIQIAKLVFKHSKVVCVGSDFLISKISQYNIKANFIKIFNPVNIELFHNTKNKRDKITKALLVSRLDKPKMISLLLEAISLVSKEREDFHVDIIGDGPQMKELKVLTNDLELNKLVTFHGSKNKIEVADLMKLSNFIMLPSVTENQPNALNEAMCCGKPVLATDAGGSPEIVNKICGILVKPNDIVAFKEGLNFMFDNFEKFDSEKISNEAKNRFGYESIARQLNEIYRMSLK